MNGVEQPKKRKRGYEPIVLPDSNTWSTNRFIDFYLRTQGYAVTASNRELVRVRIRQYEGPRPMTATALLSFLNAQQYARTPTIAKDHEEQTGT